MLCGLPLTIKAEWALVPLEDLVSDSDLIVVGTLRDVEESSHDGVDYGQGTIEVREVLWGQIKAGDKLTLKWQNSSAIICPRVEHRGNAGEKGVWLLTKGDKGSVEADYPGRFVNLSERKRVENLLRRGIFLAGGWFKANEPFTVTALYRNVSDNERSFPSLAYREGSLHLPPNSKLMVWEYDDEAAGSKNFIKPFAGQIVTDANLPPVVVPPKSETTIKFDLKRLFSTSTKQYDGCNVSLKLAGVAAANEASITVDESEERPSTATIAEGPAQIESVRPQEIASTPNRFSWVGLIRASATFALLLLVFADIIVFRK